MGCRSWAQPTSANVKASARVQSDRESHGSIGRLLDEGERATRARHTSYGSGRARIAKRGFVAGASFLAARESRNEASWPAPRGRFHRGYLRRSVTELRISTARACASRPSTLAKAIIFSAWAASAARSYRMMEVRDTKS